MSETDVSPPSPFLPGTNIRYAWDSTILGTFKTCPRLYQYLYLDGWSAKSESIHLRFGSEYHKALEHYDHLRAKGTDHEAALHNVVGATMLRTFGWDVDTNSKAGKYKNRQSLIGLVVDYLDHFGGDDSAKTYIKADGEPAVELSFRFELDFGPDSVDTPYLLCGHLDRVVEFNSALMVMDRKTTTTTLGSYYFEQWEPSNQMTLYTLAGRVVLNAPIKGVVIDAAQLLLESPNRFVRGFTYRTQDQLDEWLHDLQWTLRIAESYAEANHWPMNDTACDKYGGCMFRDICSKSPTVREKFLAADFIKLPEVDRWNPLKPR